ncbi:MAG: cadmium-translocating P-type ATPase, partial [Thermoleophilia bacterium]|nr:cadmium-translocating P-type ATPase [Thermoleophilia bacterium]
APRAPHAPGASWYARNRELTWSIASGMMLAGGFVAEKWLGLPSVPWAVAIYAAAGVLGGLDLLTHAWGKVRKGRFPLDIDLLMLVAAVGAAALGEWAEGAFLLFLFSLAHALEEYATDRARRSIAALAELAPTTAIIIKGGVETQTPIEQVRPGDTAVVRPAERIAVDGTVKSGRSSVNQAPITGESVPVEKEPGAPVYAGTVNGEGALEITVTAAAGDRTLDRVIKLVTEAEGQKAPTQRFTDKFARVFVPIVLAAAALMVVLLPFLAGLTWRESFYRGIGVLVAATPCGLALGTPAAVLAGIARAARKGVLIKGGEYLENLGAITALALDKTGTLTEGRPEVTDLAPAPGASADDLLRVAAAVEARSQHPLAQAVARKARAANMQLPEAGELQSVTGRGVRSSVEGLAVQIGSPRLWSEAGTALPAEVAADAARLSGAGRSIMIVRHGDRWLGVLGLADKPRPNVRAVLDSLRGLGMQRIVMLTGDNKGIGEAIGREVGVDEVRADLMPEDKVTVIKELVAAHGKAAMVGDGVNDAPALAAATVGIAMGGAGTAAALETADAALMGDDLALLPFAVGLSRKAKAVIRQNLVVSLAVIAFLLFATTTGFFRIGAAVMLHEGSTLVVLANALRLLAYRGPTGAGPQGEGG